MSDPIPPLLPCVPLFLASVAILLSLARTVLPVRPGPATGRHRRPGPALMHRSQVRSRRPETPLAGEATRSVRLYVVAAEQTDWKRGLELSVLRPERPGPYAIHEVGAA